MLNQPAEGFVSTHPATLWTGEVKVRFLEALSQKGNVRLACTRVGLSAETAYRQRRRDPVFARGWAAAMALARRASQQVLADRAIDGVEEEVWHRGEMVGTRRRYDTRLLLAHLARLDRAVEADETAEPDAERFDELLAVIAGAEIPAALSGEGGVPLDRERAAAEAVETACEALPEIEPADDWRNFGKALGTEELERRERASEALRAAGERATRRAEREVRRQFDEWIVGAHAAVDNALAEPATRHASNPAAQPSPDTANSGAAKSAAAPAADISLSTVSTLSTPPPSTAAPAKPR